MAQILTMFWWLVVGHAVGDFVVQGETMAMGKSRHRPPPPLPSALTQGPERGPFFPPWYYWLTAHALVHGGIAGLATQSVGVGMAEALAHWAIDFGKCEGWYGFHVDQALHIVCKAAWVLLLTWK